MIIRQANINDLLCVASLFDDYRVFYRKKSDKEGATNFIKDRLEKKDAIIFIAEEDDLCVGFTQLYPSFSSTKMMKLWVLNDLFVMESRRGEGISKELIEKSKSLCKQTNACGILLETETSNTIGNNLYPKTGFHLETNNFYFWSNV